MTHPGPGLIVRGDQGGGQGQGRATELGRAWPEQVRGLAHIGRDGGDGGGAA